MSLPTQYNGKNQEPVGGLSIALARLQANRPLRELREIAKGVTKQLPEAFQVDFVRWGCWLVKVLRAAECKQGLRSILEIKAMQVMVLVCLALFLQHHDAASPGAQGLQCLLCTSCIRA